MCCKSVIFILVGIISELIVCEIPTTRYKSCDNGPGSCDLYYEYRSINGSCNNLKYSTCGMTFTAYGRFLRNSYSDGIYNLPKAKSGKELPLARKVSNEMNPVGNVTDDKYTLGLMEFGQIIAHDFSLTADDSQIGLNTNVECCTATGQPGKDIDHRKCAAIMIPSDDPFFNKYNFSCMSLERTATTFDMGCSSPKRPADPVSAVPAYLDLSIVYGYDDDLARSLRTFKNGRMRTIERHGQMWPPQVDNVSLICDAKSQNEPCYEGGDIRINQSPPLTTLQVMFLRMHNNIAKKLEELNKHWNDEKLYQEARRINIGRYQHIVYNEYIPRILGTKYVNQMKLRYPNKNCCINDYDPKVCASITVEFATAAFRALHTVIGGIIKLVNEGRKNIDAFRLSDVINTPRVLEGKSSNKCLNIDYFAIGMSHQPEEKSDKYFNREIKQFLFKFGQPFGIDLRSFDIQRAREHGVGTYISARKFCNLTVPKTFNDLKKMMSNKKAKTLEKLYESVEDIDLSVGGLAEYKAPDALVGDTFRCIMGLQFHRSRIGDRFFYENCEKTSFTKDQLKEIRKSSFACTLCQAFSCIQKMQPEAFDKVSFCNKLRSCESLCHLDLSAWREEKRDCDKKKSNDRGKNCHHHSHHY